MKQIIILRKDLNMRKGKMIAQGCHASSDVCMRLTAIAAWPSGARNERQLNWFRQWETQHAHTKICVSVDSELELLYLRDIAVKCELPYALVEDIGKTEFNGVPTFTALAIGPAPSEILDPITGGLKLL